MSKKRLIYLPLESYKERYTSLMSIPNGWIEDKFKKNNIDFVRVEGDSIGEKGKISTGVVLDFFGRAYYSLTQSARLVKMIQKGEVSNGDIVYFEDFWTPGVEGVRYAAELAGIDLKFYTMLHAQSVDKYDFITKIKYWIRDYEIGQSKFMSGIFVTSEYLMDLCEEAGLENIYFGGLPYNYDFIISNFPHTKEKKEQVLFCSRFDKEKQPELFIELAKKLNNKYEFVMTTSADDIRSNDQQIVETIKDARDKGIVTVKTGLSKKQYYEELQKSKYQVNTALQDWLSWTMLEALTYECIPVYPRYRSFPEYLPSNYLYDPFDMESAKNIILNNEEFDHSTLDQVVNFFDLSMERYLKIMGLKD